MIYNLDNYNIALYNEFLENANKKKIYYNEYVSVRDYRWYLETERDPFLLTYAKITGNAGMFLVSKTKGVNPQDIYTFRRMKIAKDKTNLDFCKNDAYNYFGKSEYVYFINIQNRERAESLSKKIGRLYFMGFYMNTKYKVYLTDNQYVSHFVGIDDILSSGVSCFDAELQLNYEIFNLKDRLKKFSQTPYVENGKIVWPKYTDTFFKTNTNLNINVGSNKPIK